MGTKNTIQNYVLTSLCLAILTILAGFHCRASTPFRLVEVHVLASQSPIKGRVVDDSGAPLAGATVSVKGTISQAMTNDDGEFAILVANNAATISVFHVGYRPKELSVSTSFMTIVLEKETTSLDEVVVVGYGVQKKINLTGSVTQISGEELQNRPVSNVGNALQGTIPNLNVTTTSAPGGPWSKPRLNVRGTTSINGGEPLLIVDGIPVADISNLNPNDVASISVLKDAAAGAIYGARASYGVILVSTKTGANNTRTVVNVSSISGWSGYTTMPQPVNSVKYANFYNEAARNAGQPIPFSNEFIERLQQYMDAPNSIPVTTPDPNNPNEWSTANANGNVNYFDAYLKPTSFNQKYDVSLSGGNNAVSYYVSAAYYDLGGQLRYGNEKFNRYNLTSNISAKPLPWLTFDLKARYSRENTDIPYHYADDQGNWFHLAASRRPYWPVRNPDGRLTGISGLTSIAYGGRTIYRDNDLWLNGGVEMEPIRGWKINANYSYNGFNGTDFDHWKNVPRYLVDGSIVNSTAPNWVNKIAENNDYTSLNVYSSYENQWDKHAFSALVGYQQESKRLTMVNGRRMNLITDMLPSFSLGTGNQTIGDAMNEWATMGTFGRITYNYDERYLLEFNARYDGTSRFPKGKRFGFFPSASAGYNIAKEAFWPIAHIVPYFKIRGSYGSLGNQTLGNSFYPYLSVYRIVNNAPYLFDNSLVSYLSVPALVTQNLTWETVQTVNLGVDASALSNRLGVSFDWYRRNTLDMLGPAEALPVTLGTNVPLQNNADLQTRGFEVTLTWNDKIRDDFDYSISFMLSDYVSEVKKYNNPTGILTTFFPGMRIGNIWGYETDGIIQTSEQLATMPDQSLFHGRWNVGDIQYRDLDGNQIINNGKNTVTDHGDLTIIGNNTPRYSVSSNLAFAYKGIDMSMFWQGVMKRDLALTNTFFYGVSDSYSAVWENTLDYWSPDNTDAYWPIPYTTSEYNKNRQTQSRYLQNAAYIRLKNVQLGYTLPKRLMHSVRIDKCRVYVSAENLLTFSPIIESMDPETAAASHFGSGKVYPLMRTVSIGLNVGF